MASKPPILMVDLFAPSSPTKSDAAEPQGWGSSQPPRSFNTSHAHEGIYPDGFDGGNELPEDIFLDRLVYPHDESPEEQKSRIATHEREEAVQAFKYERFQQSRQFKISESGAMGLESSQGKLFEPQKPSEEDIQEDPETGKKEK